MHFCKKCDNMYYLKIMEDDDSQLIYYCRNCGTEDDKLMDSLDDMCVSKTYVTKQNADLSTLINQYTKLDPTLPRINTINCPNKSCPSNLSEENLDKKKNEIIYIRYDDSNIKFTYLCVNCDNIWRNTKSK